jgi:hypothetical protein
MNFPTPADAIAYFRDLQTWATAQTNSISSDKGITKQQVRAYQAYSTLADAAEDVKNLYLDQTTNN